MKSPVLLSEFDRPKLKPLTILMPLDKKAHTVPFYQVLVIFLAFNKGGSICPPPHVLTLFYMGFWRYVITWGGIKTIPPY